MNSQKFLGDETHPHFVEILSAWQGWRSDNRIPSRSDFDPINHPRLLPDIALFDVEDAPRRYRVRLVGTRIVKAMGRDTTGQYINDFPNTDAIIQRFDTLVESRRPYFTDFQPVTWISDNARHYSTLGLPLSHDGTHVNMIMFLMRFM